MNTSNAFDLAAVRAAQRDSQRVSDALRMIEDRKPRYNLQRALQRALTNDGQLDGFEGERDQELRRVHKDHLTLGSGFYVDAADLAPLLGHRADVVGSLSFGGYLVPTANLGLIELARPRSAALTLGATALSGLIGNVNFPRITASVTAAWMTSETASQTDSTHQFGQVSMTPKEVIASTKLSRLLLLQTSPDASQVLAGDLLAALGTAIDVIALGGSGTAGQPLGILGTPGIGTATGTTFNNGAAIDLQAAVGNRLNASGGYVAPVATAKLLAKRTADTTNVSRYVWDGGLYNGVVAGNRALATDDAPASTVIYGSWDQLIVGSWGAMQIEVAPYGTSATDFQQQLVAIRIINALDTAVRDPKAFAASTSVT